MEDAIKNIEKTERDSFIFYRSFFVSIKKLPKKTDWQFVKQLQISL